MIKVHVTHIPAGSTQQAPSAMRSRPANVHVPVRGTHMPYIRTSLLAVVRNG